MANMLKMQIPLETELEKMQIKPQRDTTSYPLGWLLLKKKSENKSC